MQDDVLPRLAEWKHNPRLAFDDWSAANGICRSFIRNVQTEAFAVTESGIILEASAEMKPAEFELFGEAAMFDDVRDTKADSASFRDLVIESVLLIGEHKRRQELSQLASRVFGRERRRFIEAFDGNKRRMARMGSEQWCRLFCLLQTAQDSFGGFPFECQVADAIAESLRRLSAERVICLDDWHALQGAAFQSVREGLRLVRWINLRCEAQLTPQEFKDSLSFDHEIWSEPRSLNEWERQFQFSAKTLQRRRKEFPHAFREVAGKQLHQVRRDFVRKWTTGGE
jgi:hypothetical protein